MPGGDRIDTVVLACTHFPLLSDDLACEFGSGVRFVDGAAGIARRIVSLTSGQDFRRGSPDLALTTGPLLELERLSPAFAVHGIDRLTEL